MRIGIIGAGDMGRTLGLLLARKGHAVFLGTRRPEAIRKWIAGKHADLQTGSHTAAAAFGEVLFLATSWGETHTILTALGDLSGKVLVDCTNPEDPQTGHEHVLGFSISAAEEIARWAPGSRVVKAFNHLYGSMLMKGTSFAGTQASVFYCGDDEEANQTIASLARDLDLDPVFVGGLHRARLLEPLGSLIVRLASQPDQRGGDIAFKLLRRNN